MLYDRIKVKSNLMIVVLPSSVHSTRPSSKSLNALAYRQAGYFTAAQAVEAGYSHQAQRHHVDAGNWDRVSRGLFRLAAWPDEPEDAYIPWGLWAGGRATVSHATALRVHDLSDADPARVHLTVPPGFRGRRDGAVLHHPPLERAEVEDRGGWRVTAPVRTVVDCADAGVGGGAGQEVLDAAVAEVLERGLTTSRRLRDAGDARGERAALHLERALSALSERA